MNSTTRKNAQNREILISLCEVQSSKWRQFLGCFSVTKNIKQLFETHSTKEQFECFTGIRFFCNIWMIYCHVFYFFIFSHGTPDTVKPVIDNGKILIFCNSIYLVDTFFVIGAFLNAYSFFANYSKGSGEFPWFKFYIKRFVRLTPVYMVILGIFYAFLTLSDSDGSFKHTAEVCERNWMWQLVYLNNFQPRSQQCMVWSWFLAIDMQFYVLSPVFMIALLRRPKSGYILAGFGIFVSCAISFILSYWYDIMADARVFPAYVDDLQLLKKRFRQYYDVLYVKPYTRLSAYLIGILLAHYFYNRRTEKVTARSWKSLCCGWTVAAILLSFSCYAPPSGTDLSRMESAVHNSLKHLSGSLGVSWIILLCITGQGGFLNRFLSCKLFVPFARLAYCTYLIHYILVMRYSQTTENVEFSPQFMVQCAVYVYFWTYIFSFIASLCIEIPIMNLSDMFMKSNRQRTKALNKDN